MSRNHRRQSNNYRRRKQQQQQPDNNNSHTILVNPNPPKFHSFFPIPNNSFSTITTNREDDQSLSLNSNARIAPGFRFNQQGIFFNDRSAGYSDSNNSEASAAESGVSHMNNGMLQGEGDDERDEENDGLPFIDFLGVGAKTDRD